MKGLYRTGWILFFLVKNVFAQDFPSASAVATSHPLATKAGMAILEQGGNAFDAAVAVASVLAVVEPYRSGLGGQGMWLLHNARITSARSDIVIDAIASVPLTNQSARNDRNETGPMTAAIPGTAAGLVYLSENYGTLPLNQTLNFAIKLAQEGFLLDIAFVDNLQKYKDKLTQFPTTRNIFFHNGNVPPVGTSLKQPDLARVLSAIAKQGYSGFYASSFASKLVDSVNKEGGIWREEDLRQYHVKILEKLSGNYHQMEITTVPFPSLGGIILLNAFSILSGFETANLSEADRMHLVIESIRQVVCDSSSLGLTHLLTPKQAQTLRAKIDINHVKKNKNCYWQQFAKQAEESTHYVILDEAGNYVAATLTLNAPWGSGFVAENTGVLLNNAMLGPVNTLSKEVLTYMAPTFINTPQGVGIVGGANGYQIPTIMVLTLLTAERDYFPHTWVMMPQFYLDYLPDTVVVEPDAMPIPLQHALALRGHQIVQKSSSIDNMQGIFWDIKKNKVYATSDPRGQGLALVKTKKH